MSRYPEEEQAPKSYQPYLRESVLTTFSLPETVMSESLETRPLENIVMSTERPIIVRNPNYQGPKQESPWKPWMPKLLLGLFVVLGLVLVLAVVLVVLAALGYLGKEKVDVIDVVRPTATATATDTDTDMTTATSMTATATTAVARALGTLAAGSRIHMVVVRSSGGKTMKSVGILVMEVMLGWTLVYLFEKFEHREKKPESRGKERSRRSRSTGSGSGSGSVSGSSRSGSSRSRGRSRGRSRARNK